MHKDNEYNEYHFFKIYALFEMILKKRKTEELDKKLIKFIPERFAKEEKEEITVLFRKIRNKIAHGDFISTEKLVEKYAVDILDGKFSFDYSEYSRKNWTIINLCILAEEMLSVAINYLLKNKTEMIKIKNKE